MKKALYFDCFNGAAGDMIVGACMDAGVDWELFSQQITSLGLPEVRLTREKVIRNGISATLFNPVIEQAHTHHHPHHRHLNDIISLINKAALSDKVRQQAIAIFQHLGQAEAKVHHIPLEQVHFHEVGAADAIVDIVGACICLELLAIDEIYCSPPALGSGTVRCDHGILPVPAPATAELIRGIPVCSGQAQGELLTPTGAAILTGLARQFGPPPAMTVQAIGYGAGQRQYPHIPNVLRVIIGEIAGPSATQQDEAAILITSIDDSSGEIIGHVTQLLLEKGALDVYCTPIYMKKNRPGTEITVICRPDHIVPMEMLLFQETSTLGIRRSICQRSILTRQFQTIQTPYGSIRIKTGNFNGNQVITHSPEFSDCQNAARLYNVSVKEVMAAAQAAYIQTRL